MIRKQQKIWSKILMILLCFSLVFGCGTIKYVPIDSYEQKSGISIDTLIVKDTVWITPQTIIKEIVPQMDTLVMESDVAVSTTYLDTTFRALRGELISKPQKIEKRERERFQIQRDTVYVSKEIPVEVVKEKEIIPRWCWVCLGIICLEVLFLIIRLVWRVKRIA